jgi:UDP-N-acetylmuramoyl-tripeptide--D-alanyl-D-alanine ligase
MMSHVSGTYEKNTEMFTIEDVIAATGGKVISGDMDTFTGISIDSRTIKAGELFVAIRGRKFDGYNFLSQALDRGNGAIIENPPGEAVNGKTIILVKDALRALQRMARYMRLKMDIPVIGITGSNGKTTTKELIASILGTRYRVLKNAGNLNNHIGLPLSLAKIDDADQIAVLEMGASAPGEIRELCEIAVPNCGVLTNISQAHLEGFKDLLTIRNTKLELLDYVDSAVVNADDAFLMEGVRRSGFKGEVITYGIRNPAEIQATDIRLHERGSTLCLRIAGNESVEVRPKISGMFNTYNLLAAASVGYLYKIGIPGIKSAIDSFAGLAMRLEIRELNGIKIISDAYNANPASMEEAIKELFRIKKGRTIAVLGDMLELGAYGKEAHKRLGRFMSGLPIDVFIAVGRLMSVAASEFKGSVHISQNAAEAGRLLREIGRKGDTVLIKGSRGMNMEEVLADVS